jgi:hypothetical protein
MRKWLLILGSIVPLLGVFPLYPATAIAEPAPGVIYLHTYKEHGYREVVGLYKAGSLGRNTSPNTCGWSGDGNNETCFQIFGPNGTNLVSKMVATSDVYNFTVTIQLFIENAVGGPHANTSVTTVPRFYGLFLEIFPDPGYQYIIAPVGKYCGQTILNPTHGMSLYSYACNTVHT